MQFEGMTPQEAAEEVCRPFLWDNEFSRGMKQAIAAACQHFYERGQASMRPPNYGDVAPGEGVAAMKPIDAFFAGWLAAADQHIDPADDVYQFMEAFGQAMPATPQWPDQATMDLRVRLVAEEFCEWLRDSGYDFNCHITRLFGVDHVQIFSQLEFQSGYSLPKSADALIDLMYVTIGSLLAMGIDMWPLWAEVHRANMAKSVDSVKAADDHKNKGLPRAEKVTKPEGWQPPDIAGLLKAQGWEDADNAVS